MAKGKRSIPKPEAVAELEDEKSSKPSEHFTVTMPPPSPSAGKSWLSYFPLVALAAVVGFALLWLLDKWFSYQTASSYVEQVADVFDLNPHLAHAITILSFVFVVIASRYSFSFSRTRRYASWAVIACALILHSLVLWQGTKTQFFTRQGGAIKCFIMTRTAITYGEREGIDPATGLECRKITPEIVERIREYENGRRPVLMTDAEPVFFDPRTGSPVIWYGYNASGQIELFDLMGFHPQSGVELLPITAEIAEKWHKQVAALQVEKSRRIPQLINPDTYGFFDALTGSPRVWFWRGPDGAYEFFDSEGFHNRTGERLKSVTPAVVDEWKRTEEEKKNQQLMLEEQQRRDAEEKVKAEAAASEVEAQRQAEVERRAQEQAAAEQRAGSDCDRLAANPTDVNRPEAVSGVPYDVLRGSPDSAIAACTLAHRQYPDEPRYYYQLARSYQSVSPGEAYPIYRALVAQHYASAYDNLGWLEIRLNKNYDVAVRLFKSGADLENVDAIMSLAGMVERGKFTPQSASDEYWQLVGRAANLGHEGARAAIEKERARRASQERNAEMMLNIFGNVLQAIPRK